MEQAKYRIKQYDFFSLLLVFALVAIGITAIGSATLIYQQTGTDYFARRQMLGFVGGFLIMLVISAIDYRFIAKFAPLIYLLNISLLVLVLVVGNETNGSARWLNLGSFTIQPSEFAKLFMILVFAKFFDKVRKYINKPYIVLLSLGMISLPVLLIVQQPDLSTGMVLLLLFVLMIFVAGISYKYILAAILIALPTIGVFLWYIQQPFQKLLRQYQIERILAMIQPEEYKLSSALQTINSIQAIGSGQLFGKGLYQGKLNQYNYLPEPQTDFIFSIIGEEFGFIGCFLVLLLLLLLIIRVLWLGKDTKDLLGQLICAGFAGMILIQVFINVGVTTGIVPNTGIPLPFISYGISSLWTNMFTLGLVLNISMQRKNKI